ncbi:MAG: hypothetical protein IIY99_02750 [Firmicutes bacterium]|nr:hypothetical protein [Bacillota bacterium]
MRQRKIKDLDSKIEMLSGHLADKDNKGKWREIFGAQDDCGLFAEIGCGKGRFIT